MSAQFILILLFLLFVLLLFLPLLRFLFLFFLLLLLPLFLPSPPLPLPSSSSSFSSSCTFPPTLLPPNTPSPSLPPPSSGLMFATRCHLLTPDRQGNWGGKCSSAGRHRGSGSLPRFLSSTRRLRRLCPPFVHVRAPARALSVPEAAPSEARCAELAAAHLHNGPQHGRNLPQHQSLTPIRGLMCSLKTRVLISSDSSIKQEMYLRAAVCILIGGGFSLYYAVTAAGRKDSAEKEIR